MNQREKRIKVVAMLLLAAAILVFLTASTVAGIIWLRFLT